MGSNTEKGSQFERKVGQLFEMLDYHVEFDVLVGGRQVDLFLSQQIGPIKVEYIVECKNESKKFSTSQYDSFRGRLTAAKRTNSPKIQGIIVTRLGFVKEVIEQSLNEDIHLIKISELENQLIDFKKYAITFMQSFEYDNALNHFIKPDFIFENSITPTPAIEYIINWIENPVYNQLTILGDYGTGKTSLLKYLSTILINNYLENINYGNSPPRIPLLIDLREHSKALSLKQLILEFLDTNAIKIKSYSTFEYMLREGRILLLVDGFDEMASRGDPLATLRNFRELNRSAMGNAKIILSCRTHYFTSNSDMRRLHNESQTTQVRRSNYTDLYREIAVKPNFRIVNLLDFDDKKVSQYLNKRCGNEANNVSIFIAETYNLIELSKRPVLLDMIVSSFDQLRGSANDVTVGELYKVYTEIWLNQNDWCAKLDVSAKHNLLREFASKVWHLPGCFLNFQEIPNLIKGWSEGISSIDSEEFDRELRTASFLVRDDEGNYRFSHRSFMEFFYAGFLLQELKINNTQHWSNSYLTSELYSFLRGLLIDEKGCINVIEKWVTNTELDDYTRANTIKILGNIRTKSIEKTMLSILSSDSSPRVRWSAASYLKNHINKTIPAHLYDAAMSDSDTTVRTNALISLILLDIPEYMEEILNLLVELGKGSLKGRYIRFYIYDQLFNCNSKIVIETAISNAPTKSNSRETIYAILKLCEKVPGDVQRKYCEKLVCTTNSPTQMGIAFGLLPSRLKQRYEDKIIARLISVSNVKTEVAPLINALRGIKSEGTKKILESLAMDIKPKIATLAIEIFAENFPTEFCKLARLVIIQKDTDFRIRLSAAKHYVKLDKEGSFDVIQSLTSNKERPMMQLAGLDLIESCNKNSLSKVVIDIWESISSSKVAQRSLEMLLGVNEQQAVDIAINKGLKLGNESIRFSTCAVLSSSTLPEVDEALLFALSNDHVIRVRRQALKSICSPGRKVSREEILNSLKNEQSKWVIRLKKELLGD